MDNESSKNNQNGNTSNIRNYYFNTFLQKKKQQLKEQQQKRQKKQSQSLLPHQTTNTPQTPQSHLTKSNQKPNSQQNYPQLPKQKTLPTERSSKVIQQQRYKQPKKVGIEQIIKDGKILKIVEKTLTPDQFKIQILYEGETFQLIATKEQILKNNIIPMLDYYEKVLGLRD